MSIYHGDIVETLTGLCDEGEADCQCALCSAAAEIVMLRGENERLVALVTAFTQEKLDG